MLTTYEVIERLENADDGAKVLVKIYSSKTKAYHHFYVKRVDIYNDSEVYFEVFQALPIPE